MNIKAENELLFETHRGLIISVAKRFSGRGIDTEELFQLGCVGFLKAAKGYDKSFNTKFTTYAVPFIAGEIRRFFRDDGQIKISRSVKNLYFKVCAAREAYIKKHGEEPGINALSEILGEDKESISYALLSSNSVSSIYTDDGSINDSVLKIEDKEENTIDKITLEDAMSSLPEKYKDIIIKRYTLNMTQADVAKTLNTSQVQISRFEKKALSLLRQSLISDN